MKPKNKQFRSWNNWIGIQFLTTKSNPKYIISQSQLCRLFCVCLRFNSFYGIGRREILEAERSSERVKEFIKKEKLRRVKK